MDFGGDTIAAIATAPGRSGVAVVRMSGHDAFEFAARICGRVPEPGRFALRSLRDPSRGESVIDEALRRAASLRRACPPERGSHVEANLQSARC